ncbi:LADA_0H14620g1_1 [Lachancea dasiensis]|uniref:Origin recognition complex subunit 1 n=1 Tax=Lachancea dasiensis TaxID=1072105 RepID=A0A1G4K4H9_9SACH|nr:LADA_0H14620g1_1 [Lachancea dasiensis]
MARNQREFEGWEIIKRDSEGQLLENDIETRRSRRRGDRGGEREHISLLRLSDQTELRCGDSIMMRDEQLDSFSIYMIHEIRLNTLNHPVEIWAFTYLRIFEFDKLEYILASDLKLSPETSNLDDLRDKEISNLFEKTVHSDELGLTAELCEIYLTDYISKVRVLDAREFFSSHAEQSKHKHFLVQYACEPSGVSFNKVDIHRAERNVVMMEPKSSHRYVKELTLKGPSTKGRKKPATSKQLGASPSPSPLLQQKTGTSILSINRPELQEGKVQERAYGEAGQASDEESNISSSQEVDDFQDATDGLRQFNTKGTNVILMENARSSSSSSSSNSSVSSDTSKGPSTPEAHNQGNGHKFSGEKRNRSTPGTKNMENEKTGEEIEQNDGYEGDDLENENDNVPEREEEIEDDEGEDGEDEEEDEEDEEDEETGATDDEAEDSEDEPERIARSTRKRSLRTGVSSPQKRTRSSKAVTSSKSNKVNGSNSVGLKKYTKKNVSRAKKAYTSFSKRFKRTQDIPDLTKLAEFNQDQIDLDVAALESKLRSPKKQHTTETIFSKVKQQLYTSHGKDSIMKASNFDDYLPARENEFASIYLSLYSAIEAGTGTTVYVAGTPGVGKTLTVREVVKELLQSVDQNELPKFQYVEINGLKMIKPSDSYEVLWNKISGERLTSGAAMESLEFYFNKVPKNKKRPILVLLDELDALVTKSQDVMYNFFNWTTYTNAKLVVVAVANTMDLPERQLGNKVSSRIGFTRIMFTGYNHDELKTIINLRLKGLNESYFYVDAKNGSAHIITDENETPDFDPSDMLKVKLKIAPDAIEIASRKIASVSGDARRALKACKRAVEIAEHDYMERHGYGYDGTEKLPPKKLTRESIFADDENVQYVKIFHIMKALNESVTSPVVLFMTNLPFTTKLFLHSMVALIRKTGCQEQPLGDIVDEIKSSIDANGKNKYIVEMQRVLFNQDKELTLEQLRIVSWEFLVNQLIEAGIIIRQNLKNERLSAIKFSVSLEDVKFALDQDKVMKTI